MDEVRIVSPTLTTISHIPIAVHYKNIVLSDSSILEDFLEQPIEYIEGWSVRTRHVFKNNSFEKIKDIFNNFEKIRLLKYRNFGERCYGEVLRRVSTQLKRYLDSETVRSKLSQTRGVENNGGSTIAITKGILGTACRNKINTLCKIINEKDKISKLLDTPIEHIDWSVRAENVFKKNHIENIGDFSKIDSLQLMQERNFGEKCLVELVAKLENYIERFVDAVSGESERVIVSCDLEGLVRYMLSKLSPRQNKIISRRYGLWDGKRETLENLGIQFRVTRERIRQIQQKGIARLRRFIWSEIIERGHVITTKSNTLDLFMKEFFDIKLRSFMEENFNVATKSELVEIIYAIDGEEIAVDLANEFLSEVFFKGRPLFHNFVVELDKEVVGLHEIDRDLYKSVLRAAKKRLGDKGIPQNIDDLLIYFEKSKLSEDWDIDREKLRRFLSISPIPRDSTEKFGIRKWKYFSSYTLPCMIERALVEIGKPTHFTQIALLMNEMFPKYAPFKDHNIHSRISSDKGGAFVWVAPGVYGLKRWGLKRPPYLKDCLVELLQLADSPLHKSALTQGALERCNCSSTSVSMTLDFCKDTFIKYQDNFYGLMGWE